MPRTLYRAFVILLALTAAGAARAELRGLILTSPGVYHDYAYQSEAIAAGVASRADIRFDVSLAEFERWKSTDFAAAYDVIVYNICSANNRDRDLIANLRRQTEELGVPALVIHCTMHSFRDTDQWWPFLGLRTRTHEALRPLPQERVGEHFVLEGIPADWRVSEDELYINLAFDGHPLLTSTGEDGRAHVTTWLRKAGRAEVFGTTLGHTRETMDDPVYRLLLANAVLYLTGEAPRTAPAEGGFIGIFSAPEGVAHLDEDGRECAMAELRRAVAPCYLGCVLNPMLWGEAAAACKDACVARSPSTDELAAKCTPP